MFFFTKRYISQFCYISNLTGLSSKSTKLQNESNWGLHTKL